MGEMTQPYGGNITIKYGWTPKIMFVRYGRYCESFSYGNKYGVIDRCTNKPLNDTYELSDWIQGADKIVNMLNNDEMIYFKEITKYIGEDLAIECPQCKTINYHFNNGNMCCAFC